MHRTGEGTSSRDCHAQDGSCPLHQLPGRSVRVDRPSLAAADPHLAAMLDEAKSGFTAKDVARGSKVLTVWKCSQGHTWCATVNSVSNARGGTGCGVCAGKSVIFETSLRAVAPQLATEWDSERNQLLPEHVSPQSNTLFYWRCPVAVDHRWEASPNNRFGRGSGCPCCAGQQASSTNNLTLYNRLMREWDSLENGPLDPASLSRGSKRSVWWKCATCNLSYEAQIQRRTSGGGCPYCTGHRVSHLNSVASKAPDLVDEWDVDRNDQTPDEVAAHSNRRDIWWRCRVNKRHRWQAQPNNRVKGHQDCPECWPGGHSAQEVRLAYQLSHVLNFDPKYHTFRLTNLPIKCDMILPERRLIIEFDGAYWHRGDTCCLRDCRKANKLREGGWHVVRVRELPLELTDVAWDISVAQLASADLVARSVLRHLAEKGLIPDAKADALPPGGSAAAAEQADRYLKELRAGAGRE